MNEEGELKKRRITALDAEFLVKLGEFKVSDCWIPMKLIEDAKKEVMAAFPKKEVIGTRMGGDDEEYNEEGYSEEAIEKLKAILVRWFGK